MGSRTHILVVDDDLDMLLLFSRLLVRLGYKTSEAVSGAEALERLANGDGIGLVLTDINMPRMDGWELARRIRADRPQLPILAITGESREVILPRLRGSAIGRALFKPVRLEELQGTLREILKEPDLEAGTDRGVRPQPDQQG